MLSTGPKDGDPVVFVHGNFSSSTYFEELMVAMPPRYRSLAVDLRGYGETEDKPIDATRGAKDWADDLLGFLNVLDLPRVHFVAWSAGAAAVMQVALDCPQCISSLTLVAPVSPFGFGGSRDVKGSLCNEDCSGSGGGVLAPEFVERIYMGDSGIDSEYSPRNVINNSYFHKPLILAREEQLVQASLRQKLGGQRYPGDSVASTYWPFVSPGKFGPLNAVSPKYLRLNEFANISPKPPVLWIRGDKDIIVSNYSYSDLGVLGREGLVPDWPGEGEYPPQPMVDQTRELLLRYQANGGYYQEFIMENVGHSPFIEEPEIFLGKFTSFLTECDTG